MNEEEMISEIEIYLSHVVLKDFPLPKAIKMMYDQYKTYKEKNKKLEMKLKYDIEKINEKLLANQNYSLGYILNDYQIARLKGIRTKCKEILRLIKEEN